jgi:hypothetical protein
MLVPGILSGKYPISAPNHEDMAVARAARMTALQPAGSVHPMPSIRILKPVDGEILRDSPTQVRPSAGAAQPSARPTRMPIYSSLVHRRVYSAATDGLSRWLRAVP